MILLQESQQPRMGEWAYPSNPVTNPPPAHTDSELGPDTAVVSRMLEEALNSEERTEPAADNR